MTMTLKQAMAAFEAEPNAKTADALATIAKRESEREKLGINSHAAIAVKLEAAGFKSAILKLIA